jgi:predicted nucleic acid-binding Zn ribbon protein
MMADPWMRLGDLIPPVLARLKQEVDSPLQKVHSLWEDIAGPEAAAHTHPIRVQNGILLVFVDSQVRKAELARFESERILAAIREALGSEEIRDLHFTTQRPARFPRSGESTDAKGRSQI